MRKIVFSAVVLFLLASSGILQAQESERIGVHDPVMIQEEDTYYLFCTGRGITVWSSPDMKSWKREQPVFSNPPQWALDAVAGFRGHIWAPDVAFYNGQYYLYYSVSAFGKNTSCIGVATNKTLDPESPDFQWIDHGKVIQSFPGETNWNAIDPNLIVSEEGVPYLSFGSFWDGLKMFQLDQEAKKPAKDLADLETIASRNKASGQEHSTAGNEQPVNAGPNAIEAPFIFKKGDYYYLFASIDYCCRGIESTYKMIIGRSKNITGPFLDKEGNDMATGGGSLLLAGNEDWPGVGHNSAYTFNGVDYLVFHGYDAHDEGRSKLLIKKMTWDQDQWPIVEL